VPASTILLLDSDPVTGAEISAILTTAGYTITLTDDPDAAFGRAAEHQLIILDVTSGPKSAVDLCREIRSTPALAAVPVMCVSATDDVEERIRFLEAGADDVMARPFDARELEARVEALLLRFQRSRDLAPIISSDGLTMARAKRTVAVFSPKGGVGTTTVATNVAVAAASRRPDKVVLIDFALPFGNVAAHLNLEANQTIADVVRDDTALKEPELLRTYAVRHDSGLHVLAAPSAPDAAETITTAHVEQIIKTALESYDYVVIDAGSNLDDRTLAIFEAAETVILTVYPEIAALNAMHSLLEYLGEAGSVGLRSTFVVNDIFAREILKLRDVESALGSKVSIELPYDPFIYLKAVNEGVPVFLGAPRSAAAERLNRLSQIAFGEDGLVVPVTTDSRKSGGLFRIRR
jgi:pilus assembly protein CpaE